MQQEANLYKGSIPPTELIITEEEDLPFDILPEDTGDNIILVGDQEEFQQFQNVLIELN